MTMVSAGLILLALALGAVSLFGAEQSGATTVTPRTLFSSTLNGPTGVAKDANGNIYVADSTGNQVTVYPDTTGTLFGQTVHQFTAAVLTAASSGTGNAALQNPVGLAVDSNGDLFIANNASNDVVVLAPTSGTVFGVSVTADVPTVVASGLNAPDGLAFDSSGNLFIANNGSGGGISVLPAANGAVFGQTVTADTLTALTAAGTNRPNGITFDFRGDLAMANNYADTVTILPEASGTLFGQSLTADQATTLFSSSNGLQSPTGVASDSFNLIDIVDNASGTIYAANPFAVTEYPWAVAVPASSLTPIVTGLSQPFYAFTDNTGSLSVTSFGGGTLLQLAYSQLTFAPSPATGSVGSNTTFPVSVEGYAFYPKPTGTVSISVGSISAPPLCTITLASGSGSCSTTALPQGSDQIFEVYSGDSVWAPEALISTYTVTAATTTTTTTTVPPTTTTVPPPTTTTTAPPTTTTVPPAPVPTPSPSPSPSPSPASSGSGAVTTPNPTSAPVSATGPSSLATTSTTTPPAPNIQLSLGFQVGQRAAGQTVTVSGQGLLPSSAAVVTLHSVPVILGSITVGPSGGFRRDVVLPEEIPPGTHHIAVTGTGDDGQPATATSYFQIDAQGVVTHRTPTAVPSPPPWASAPFFAPGSSGQVRIGGTTYARYIPARHLQSVLSTTTAAFSLLALVAGVGAALPLGLRQLRSGEDGATDLDDQSGSAREKRVKNTGAGLASAKVKHVQFRHEARAWGDKSATWALPGVDWLDQRSLELPPALNRFSPLLARVANDGSYLRAMFGPAWVVCSVVGLVLGALSVHSADGPVPPSLALVLAIVILSAFDVLGGLVAALAFSIGVGVTGGLGSAEALRTLMGVDVIFFTVLLTASASRPLRRKPPTSAAAWFDRTADVVVATLVGMWAIEKMVGALPAFSGAELPLANSAGEIALVTGIVVFGRYLLETLASHLYPLRLQAVAPEKIEASPPRQQLVSAVLKTAIFVFFAVAYLGNVWELYLGAALFFVPFVVDLYQEKLPNVAWLKQLLPGGVFKVVLMLCIGKLFGYWFSEQITNPVEVIALGFIVLSIPGMVFDFMGFFGRDGKSWTVGWSSRIIGVGLVIFAVLVVQGVISIT